MRSRAGRRSGTTPSLPAGTSDTKPDRILVLHLRFDIDQKRRDDRVGEPGHRRGHHAQKLEDGVIAKHRLRRRQAGEEVGEFRRGRVRQVSAVETPRRG